MLQLGILCRAQGSSDIFNGLFSITEIHCDWILLIRRPRQDSRKVWVKRSSVILSSFVEQATEIYSVEGVASPICTFGEHPRSNCMNILRTQSTGKVVFTWILGIELWRITGLPFAKYAFIAGGWSSKEAGSRAGNTIPLKLLQPQMDFLAHRLRQHQRYRQARLHAKVPYLHLDSPTVATTRVLILLVMVRILVAGTFTSFVLRLFDGSVIGEALGARCVHRERHLQPLAQQWATFLGIRSKVEHVAESKSFAKQQSQVAHLPRLVVFGVVMQYVLATADLVSSGDDEHWKHAHLEGYMVV